MAGEPTSISWESLHDMFDESPQMETAPHRSYSLTTDTNSQAVRDWPNFDAATESSSPVLPDEARLGVQHALISSNEEIHEIYKVTSTEVFFSEAGRIYLDQIVRAKSDTSQRGYFVQQLVKEIITKAQSKGSKCTYSEAIAMWQEAYPMLNDLNLPHAEDLLLKTAESSAIADSISGQELPTQDKVIAAIESALNERISNGPLAVLKKHIADLAS